MKINRYNYNAQFGDGLDTLMKGFREMLVDGNYVLGEALSQFEHNFGKFHGVSYVSGVNSGTDALVIGLLAAGVEPGDEIITQANTFNATVAAICIVGCTPVLVDVDEETFLIDLTQIESAITSRTKVLLPVHLYGKPSPMGPILNLAERYGLITVEDAAQAHGAKINGRLVGSFGNLACFSFHPSKNLAAAGDGGAVVTSDRDMNRNIKQRRALGQDGQNNHVILGFNSKLDSIQAFVLDYKLTFLDDWNRARRRISKMYRQRLARYPLRFQREDESEEHVYHLFQIRTDSRDQLMQSLRDNGVDATVRYPVPIHLQPAFANHGWDCGQFPVAECLSRELLCLPIRPDMTEAEVDYVVNCIHRFF